MLMLVHWILSQKSLKLSSFLKFLLLSVIYIWWFSLTVFQSPFLLFASSNLLLIIYYVYMYSFSYCVCIYIYSFSYYILQFLFFKIHFLYLRWFSHWVHPFFSWVQWAYLWPCLTLYLINFLSLFHSVIFPRFCVLFGKYSFVFSFSLFFFAFFLHIKYIWYTCGL